MRKEGSPVLSSENLQTVVAVCFVLSLLAVTFNFYNFTRVQRAEDIAVRAASVDVKALHGALAEARQETAELRDQVGKLEQELAGMKAQASAAPAPAQP